MRGVFADSTGFKAAWFKDPDGNSVALEQLADTGSVDPCARLSLADQ